MQNLLFRHLAVIAGFGVFSVDTATAQSTDILLNCTSCHQISSEGNSIYPVLNGLPAQYIIEQLQAYRDGTRTHPQMQQTARALGAGGAVSMARMYADAPAPSLTAPAGGDHDAARTLELEGAWERGIAPCAMCHNVADASTAGTPTNASTIDLAAHNAPRIHGQPETYLASTLRAYASGARQTGGMGRMQAYAAKLTDAEISDLAAYLSAFAASEDK